jgi:2-dehydro-3-deoxyphosphogluconate aldolase / (4S)-4-hydroxy-2-oxoglutarate aldolase
MRSRSMNSVIEPVTRSGVVVIIRLRSADGFDEIAQAAIRGGAGALEVTMNTPGGLKWLRRARDRFGEKLLLGVGTVLDAAQAAEALDAGAQFLVAPGFDGDVVAAAKRAGALAMPGAFTPTEIVTAWRAGADIVKLFPARVGGPKYLADVIAPLDQIPLLPTGGVDEKNAAEFIRAGAVAVAVGSSIVNARAVAERRFDEMAERLRQLVRSIAEARGERALLASTS